MARSACRECRLVPTLVIACAAYVGPAQAEKWSILPAIDTRVTWTDNANFDEQGVKKADTLFEATPSVSLLGEGKRFRISGHLSVTGLAYANGTNENTLLPEVDLTANLEAIERFFFIEAGVISRQTATDVFAPRPEGASSFNTETTTDYRIIPSFQGQITPDVRYQLRSANDWSVITGAPAGTPNQNQSYSGEHTLRMEHQPVPLGWSFELGRTVSVFENQVPPKATDDTARIGITDLITSAFTLGVHGGYEKTNLVTNTDKQESPIYGFEMRWKPSERTDLDWLWEERFFGPSWHFRFDHRMPRVAFNVVLSRDVESFAQSFLTLPATNNVAGLLDAAFTTRFPDPTERARAVANLMAQQGLPSSLAAPTSLAAQRVTVVTERGVQFLVTGVRNSLVLGAYSNRTQDLSDSIFVVTGSTPLDVLQEGGSFTFSHQVTTLTALNLIGWVSRNRDVDTSTRTYQRGVRLQMTREVGPKTTVYVGARAQNFDSNAAGVAPKGDEHAAFVGLGHRF